MTPKLFEIRDSATCIPVLAVCISREDGWLARRAGFGDPCIQVVWLESKKTTWDPYDWCDRTMQTAHLYIQDHWDNLPSESVIDVEFILGETTIQKRSERVGE